MAAASDFEFANGVRPLPFAAPYGSGATTTKLWDKTSKTKATTCAPKSCGLETRSMPCTSTRRLAASNRLPGNTPKCTPTSRWRIGISKTRGCVSERSSKRMKAASPATTSERTGRGVTKRPKIKLTDCRRRQRWSGKKSMNDPATLSVRGGAAVRVQPVVSTSGLWSPKI